MQLHCWENKDVERLKTLMRSALSEYSDLRSGVTTTSNSSASKERLLRRMRYIKTLG